MINRRRVTGNIGNIMPIFGVPPITTNKSKLLSLKAFGGTEQSGTPTPDNPIDIVSNNGVLKIDNQGNVYTDGIQETIEVHGKNLLNPANIEEDIATYYTDFPNNECVGYHLSLKAGTYTFSVRSILYNTYLRYKYSGQEWSNYNVINKNPITHTYTSDVEIAIFSGSNGNNIKNMLGRDIQLEQGSTATAYEPYFNGGTAIAEMLLKVGQYKDEQSVLDGVVTRNVGIKVLDGTEDWTDIHTDAPYVVSIPDMIGPTSADGDRVWTMNTHFIVIARSPSWSQYSNLCSTNTGRSSVQFRYKDNQSTLANFKQYLADQYNAGTPVIIVYPLATPTTEQVVGQHLTLTRGTNVIDITQASLDNLELEVNAK